MGAIESQLIRRRIHVEGVVQGVGFRPYVYRLATVLGLSGSVRNDVGGVEIEVEGPSGELSRFLERLPAELPEMSRIDSLEVEALPAGRAGGAFTIAETDAAGGKLRVAVTPDAHVCEECLRELADPQDRRFRYPFINCTNCGPRFTIVERLPYDRPNTTMAAFELCEACSSEYSDPLDRRFHAQPVACPACGPRLWLAEADGRPVTTDADPIDDARRLLLAGEILAVKGIGGFHLAVLATDDRAVARLRKRKGRGDRKPFALMARDIDQTLEVARLSTAETDLLQSTARPIVLLARRDTESGLAPSVAPGLDRIGVMLPYSPIHHLLLEEPMPPLVMTSGNPSEEPITTDNADAVRRLGPLCDALLLHDREIRSGCDDSVAQVIDGRPQLLRRSRGYVPRPLTPTGPAVEEGVIALGGELKGALCITRAGRFVMGRHLGELHNLAAQENLRVELRRLPQVLGVTPRVVVHDLHPDYFTTRVAAELAATQGLKRVSVQHHHAHLASCLAENDMGLDERAVGVVFDGTGYGQDGTIWGGEILVGGYREFRRAAHLRPLALPGGDAAILNPFRAALAALLDAFGRSALELSLPVIEQQPRTLLRDLARMVDAGIGCPRSSGMGRLFDVAAAVIGLPGGLAVPISYEAQAAMELEAAAARAADAVDSARPYPFELTDGGVIDWRPLLRALVGEVLDDEPAPILAARLHASVVELTAEAVRRAAEQEQLRVVALSGGCFHNKLLTEGLSRKLKRMGYHVLRQQRVPCGDGGLALGQAAVAGARGKDDW